MNLCNPTELKALLNRHGFNFSKTLGQNFLIDKNVLNKIVSASELNENSCVLEIGPGAGTLTQRLAETGARCTAVEIDKALLPILGETLAGFDNFNLINSDILKVDLKKLIKDEFDNKPFHVIANLPYYITTPIIMQILESRLPVVSMTLMVQKEVADRMCATCGSKEYGALSVAVQYYTIPTVICRAEPHCFIPQPKVASSVVHLKVSPTPTVTISDEKKFFAIVKSSFGQRRKTLLNALSKSPYFSANKDSVRSALVQMGVDENIRGEKLSISQFAKLSELL
ncbi:MAG: 16S rRNA (adenine(1518)-N(6)/adenine(1519)-N(6))-dimethyltransferase RsmA [Eubacteriales bacterium]|nr:16S rRNA (adenine(1518)-N(6)/adenine(1519)-N(6))-dimethyltransferase RsmA [Eubacteriales bacterium]